ncbi:hypothetical protein M0R45_025546 [Rubus argutus]|uniref:Uncharacterized protein n=1 Tax=Rubus argutus TaxID=59490 RepID=A0AAW1WXA1_RUBAR
MFKIGTGETSGHSALSWEFRESWQAWDAPILFSLTLSWGMWGRGDQWPFRTKLRVCRNLASMGFTHHILPCSVLRCGAEEGHEVMGAQSTKSCATWVGVPLYTRLRLLLVQGSAADFAAAEITSSSCSGSFPHLK